MLFSILFFKLDDEELKPIIITVCNLDYLCYLLDEYGFFSNVITSIAIASIENLNKYSTKTLLGSKGLQDYKAFITKIE